MADEVKGTKGVFEESVEVDVQASAPSNPVAGKEKYYPRAGSLRALDSTGSERNVEGPQKVTENDSTGPITVLVGTTYWHPSLDIQSADIYTVNVGGTLVSAGDFIVQGSLISNGDTIVL